MTDLPQDLLLIQGLVDIKPHVVTSKDRIEDSSTVSPDSGVDSEDDEQAVASLIVDEEESSPSSPEVSSSDVSDSELGSRPHTKDLEDEDETGPTPLGENYFTTKNEILEAQINIPNIKEVSQEEELEEVGKILNIMGNTVIVEGIASRLPGRGMDRALDSDTLLVFEDRQVFGYIYETFGPTYQPRYQVKFNTAFPLDPSLVREGRLVYHVPQRSRFVFVSQIKQHKGSDASNVNDEEPAEDELEFSDDEAEAAHKLKIKRLRRTGSLSSSRQVTPAPSHLRDQDMEHESLYTEQGPYGADPPRPSHIPYDDPYAEEFLPYDTVNDSNTTTVDPTPVHVGNNAATLRPVKRSRGRGRGSRAEDRSSRGRYGSRSHYLDRGQDNGQWMQGADSTGMSNHFTSSYPTPSTSQQSSYYPEQDRNWSQYQFNGSGLQQQLVQPHINPRFASALGFDFWQQNAGYSAGPEGQPSYNSNFTRPSWHGGSSQPPG